METIAFSLWISKGYPGESWNITEADSGIDMSEAGWVHIQDFELPVDAHGARKALIKRLGQDKEARRAELLAELAAMEEVA